jgi:hypothetical protein
MTAHDLTQQAWIARFREYFTEKAGLDRGTAETESILEGECEWWISGTDPDSWEYETPEGAVLESLSYWVDG